MKFPDLRLAAALCLGLAVFSFGQSYYQDPNREPPNERVQAAAAAMRKADAVIRRAFLSGRPEADPDYERAEEAFRYLSGTEIEQLRPQSEALQYKAQAYDNLRQAVAGRSEGRIEAAVQDLWGVYARTERGFPPYEQVLKVYQAPAEAEAAARASARTAPEHAKNLRDVNERISEIQSDLKANRPDEGSRKLKALYGELNADGTLELPGGDPAELRRTVERLHKTEQMMPEDRRSDYLSEKDKLDRIIQRIAYKETKVPLPGAKAPSQGEPPGQAKLAFYAALESFPLTSAWAKQEMWKAQTERGLHGDPNVSQYAEAKQAGPDGRAHGGVEAKFNDGSSRFESPDGYAVATAASGKVQDLSDPKTGLFRRTIEGREVAKWTADPQTGRTQGTFYGRRFSLQPGEQARLSPDGTKVYMLGSDSSGKPAVRGWITQEGERIRLLPRGRGYTRDLAKDGVFTRQTVLDPALIKRSMQDGKFDLSSVPPGDLSPESRKQLEAFLKTYPSRGALIDASFKDSPVLGADGKTVVGRQWVDGVFVQEGRLHLLLRSTAGGKEGPSETVVAEPQKDGSVKAYYFADKSVFVDEYSADFKTHRTLIPDEDKQAQGRIVFRQMSRDEYEDGHWVRKESDPVRLGSAKPSVIKAVMGTVGEGVGAAFSPFQSGLHAAEAGIWYAGGSVAGGEAGGFSKVGALYTLRQAKFAEYAGKGTQSEGEMMAAYGDSRAMLSPEQDKAFVNFLDLQVDEGRRRYYGELYKFHRDDPVTDRDRAQAAARTFGLSNMPSQSFQFGREAFERGDKVSGVLNYAAGGFTVAGESYVEGLGFGLAAQPLKLAAIGGRMGMTGEEVAAAVSKAAAGAKITQREAAAAKAFRWTNQAEFAVLGAPAGAQAKESAVGLYHSIKEGDSDGAWASFNGLYQSASGLGGSGFGLVRSRVGEYVAGRAPSEPAPAGLKPAAPRPSAGEPRLSAAVSPEAPRAAPRDLAFEKYVKGATGYSYEGLRKIGASETQLRGMIDGYLSEKGLSPGSPQARNLQALYSGAPEPPAAARGAAPASYSASGRGLSPNELAKIKAADLKALKEVQGLLNPGETARYQSAWTQAREVKYSLLESGAVKDGDLIHGTSVKSLQKIVQSGGMEPGELNIDGMGVYVQRIRKSDLAEGRILALESYGAKAALRDNSAPVLLRMKGLSAEGPDYAARVDYPDGRSSVPLERIEAFDPAAKTWKPVREFLKNYKTSGDK